MTTPRHGPRTCTSWWDTPGRSCLSDSMRLRSRPLSPPPPSTADSQADLASCVLPHRSSGSVFSNEEGCEKGNARVSWQFPGCVCILRKIYHSAQNTIVNWYMRRRQHGTDSLPAACVLNIVWGREAEWRRGGRDALSKLTVSKPTSTSWQPGPTQGRLRGVCVRMRCAILVSVTTRQAEIGLDGAEERGGGDSEFACYCGASTWVGSGRLFTGVGEFRQIGENASQPMGMYNP